VNHETWSESQAETTVTVDGHELSMAYRDEGEGEPVVFLHGIPTWSFLWRRIAPQLAEQFRTIVPDFVGYGNSDRRDTFDRSIRAQERAVADLVDQLGLEEFHVVGHDIGGGVALRYAAHTNGRVDKLVLSNATAYGSWPVEYITTLGLPGRSNWTPTRSGSDSSARSSTVSSGTGRTVVSDIGGEIVALDDAGHWVTEDRPDAYRDHLETFLAG